MPDQEELQRILARKIAEAEGGASEGSGSEPQGAALSATTSSSGKTVRTIAGVGLRYTSVTKSGYTGGDYDYEGKGGTVNFTWSSTGGVD